LRIVEIFNKAILEWRVSVYLVWLRASPVGVYRDAAGVGMVRSESFRKNKKGHYGSHLKNSPKNKKGHQYPSLLPDTRYLIHLVSSRVDFGESMFYIQYRDMKFMKDHS
jgi:hypothetical protein